MENFYDVILVTYIWKIFMTFWESRLQRRVGLERSGSISSTNSKIKKQQVLTEGNMALKNPSGRMTKDRCIT